MRLPAGDETGGTTHVKIRGGYLPRVAGRPSSEVLDVAVPARLWVRAPCVPARYHAVVPVGASVAFGRALAEADWPGGRLVLSAPAAGTVARTSQPDDGPLCMALDVADATPAANPQHALPDLDQATDVQVRQALAAGGVWPGLEDVQTRGMPALDAPAPKAVVVKTVLTEPFRARGDVLLYRHMEQFLRGLTALHRLLAPYGMIHLVLTGRHHPLAAEVQQRLKGRAWVQAHFVPRVYPADDSRVLWRALVREEASLAAHDPAWFVDIQTAVVAARCVGEGVPVHERLVAVGGPGHPHARHALVRVGTPVSDLLADVPNRTRMRVVLGGMFTGRTVCPDETSIGPTDDAVFVVPREREREFLGFMRPRRDRESYSGTFLSSLLWRRAYAMDADLGGERRPCIGCGYCEEVCPVGVMPHLLYRYLSRDLLEEADAAGADRCVACGLCTYVCPSKIDLHEAIQRGMERVRAELRPAPDAPEADTPGATTQETTS